MVEIELYADDGKYIIEDNLDAIVRKFVENVPVDREALKWVIDLPDITLKTKKLPEGFGVNFIGVYALIPESRAVELRLLYPDFELIVWPKDTASLC